MRSCKQVFFSVVVSFFLVLPQQVCAAEKEKIEGTLALYIENDLFAMGDNDRYYTHGTKLSWISGDISEYHEIRTIPRWLYRFMEKLPFVNDPGEQRFVSLSLGQSIYTPEDKQRSDLIVNDRPYAGITYLAMGLHSRNSRRMDTLGLDIGIVGRHSYAEDAQLWIHDLIQSYDPKGWGNQLHDEPIVNGYAERKWKVLKTDGPAGLGFDFIPHVGMALGNAWTGMNIGGQIRSGWNIPNDFGTYPIRPGEDNSAPQNDDGPGASSFWHNLGFHLFLGVEGNFVVRDILLDGNTFRDSHSVAKKPFVADFIGGFGITVHRFRVTYSYVYRTKEFEAQREDQKFGSVSLSFTF